MLNKRIAIYGLVAMMMALCHPQACVAQPLHAQASASRSVPLDDYLINMGQKLSLFFTIEAMQSGHKTLSPLQIAVLPASPQPTSKEALILFLKSNLPSAAVFQDGHTANVIHIVETSLTKSGDYALQDHLDFSFSGRLNDLPDALSGPLQGRIGRQRFFAVGFTKMDLYTHIAFNVKGRTVRSLLTDFVPIPKYSHILWDAVTQEVNGKPVTLVAYHG